MTTHPSVMLDRRAMCAVFGVHPSTIHRLIRRNLLPRPIKVGASSRWLRSEVEACLAQMSEARNV
jgi:predicted DNA-binding transcriptional regulator AlpA